MSDIFLRNKQQLNTRFPVIYLVITILFGVLLLKLINLQVVKGNENLFLSSTIKTSETIIRAPRGLIFDRDSNLLVINRPAFKLFVDLNQLAEEREREVISLLSQILEVEEGALWENFLGRAYESEGERVSLSQVTLLNDVERDKVVSISSRIEELPGVYIEVGTTREYLNSNNFAHVVGYVREVSQTDLESGNFAVGDVVGATGIEQYYDSILRGVNGRRITETDRDEIAVRELIPLAATPGESVQLTIDSDMQNALTEALWRGIERTDASGGVAIIEDLSNGEILALVSLPTFDPNEIIRGLSWSEYLELEQDSTLPLYNRAISLPQPPGSTFKTIVASAALEEGVVTSSTVFESLGCMDLGGGYEFCEAGKRILGKLDLYHGISRSSNIYFCNTMLRLGIDNLNKYTDDFGLGQKTGIDLPSEQPGSVASKELKMKLEESQWYQGDSCNTAIGQGLMEVTPIQMLSWVTAIANGGRVLKPHLATAFLDGEGNKSKIIESEVIHTLPVSAYNLEIVREGMHLAVQDPGGSAFPLRGLKSDPAVKTGSAEDFRQVDGRFEKQGHSWVTGFFPYDEPRYSFVVYLEYGGWGYKSAEVMKEFLTWYESEYQMQ